MDISEFKGKIFKSIEKTSYYGNEALSFVDTEDNEFIMTHLQDCCESVTIDDIVGDLKDLVGNPILFAEESTNSGEAGVCDSYTWTFYKLATVKGWVDIRWFGSSNGYYSEDVSLFKKD